MISQILNGDCVDLMRSMEANSVDAIVTDPPYGLGQSPDMMKLFAALVEGSDFQPKGRGFMGKEWDALPPLPRVWRECYRVLKPGGHLLAFAGSRTVDLMGVFIRFGGFEIRDQLQWLYSSGFPKSLAIDKAIDRKLDVRPKIIGHQTVTGSAAQSTKDKGGTYASNTDSRGVRPKTIPLTGPGCPESEPFDGWGTALKPAHEPIILARKPVRGTVAENALAYGTGGLNIDATRIEGKEVGDPNRFKKTDGGAFANFSEHEPEVSDEGWWPANVILDPGAGAILDQQTGEVRSNPYRENEAGGAVLPLYRRTAGGSTDRGRGPSRFFYCPKASKAERNAGLEDFAVLTAGAATDREDGSAGLNSPRAGSGRTGGNRNAHPTVKPIALMRWLAKLSCPKGGLILDPFVGSGTTGIAAALEGFDFIGCELSPEYVQIARARLVYFVGRHAVDCDDFGDPETAEITRRQLALF